MNVIFIVVVSLVLLGILLLAIGTVAKNRWGINLEPVNCAACGSPMPQVRQPKSLREGFGLVRARNVDARWTSGAAGCSTNLTGNPTNRNSERELYGSSRLMLFSRALTIFLVPLAIKMESGRGEVSFCLPHGNCLEISMPIVSGFEDTQPIASGL